VCTDALAVVDPGGRGPGRTEEIKYYRARYYDPSVGRFISEDPIGLKAGVNEYAYVLNRPTNAVDPEGLKTLICCRHLTWTSARDHCFIVICGDDSDKNKATTYSLLPNATLTVGNTYKNFKEDKDAYVKGETTGCYVVGDCGPDKEQSIDTNYTDAGPSKNYGLRGPNSNTYTKYQTTKAGCTPPGDIPYATGYTWPK
jgi:RHS repeat-associated protein